MKKKCGFEIIFMILFCFICGGMCACDLSEANKGDSFDGRRPVKAIKLESLSTEKIHTFPGVSKAAREVKLAFRVGGPLIEMKIKIGQHVNKGQVIARIDPRDFEVSVSRLKSGIGEAGANLKVMRRGARDEDIKALKARLKAAGARFREAGLTYERHKKLYGQNVTSKSRFDHAQAANDMASADVEAARQNLQKAEKGARAEDIEAMTLRIEVLKADLEAALNALDDTTMRAPFTGYINAKFVENYETVKPGQSIVSLLDFSGIEVGFGVPGGLAIRESDFKKFTCEFDSYPGVRIKAELKEIGKKAQSSNQTWPLAILLHPPENLIIRPGMTATVEITLGANDISKTRLNIPIESLVNDREKNNFVWIYDENTGSVNKRIVETGKLVMSGIEITNGLNPGEWLVTAGVHHLRENMEARLLAVSER